MSLNAYRHRRERVLQALGEGVMVIATAPEAVRNRDAHHPYRFDSYFYYLTGFTEPEAVLVLVGGQQPQQILFCREKNQEREIWDGFRHGPEAAREAFGFDVAHAIAELDEQMPRLLENQAALHFAIGHDSAWDARVVGWLNAVRAKTRSGVQAPEQLLDARRLLDEMRLFKDDFELELMRRAADISAAAHIAAMRATRPGRHEHEIEAELLYAFRRQGAEAPAASVRPEARRPISPIVKELTDDERDAGDEPAGRAADGIETRRISPSDRVAARSAHRGRA